MKVAILVPTLGRPHAVRALLQSLAITTPPGSARVIFVTDHDDPETHQELQSVHKQGWEFGTVFADGTYPKKVNAGFVASTEDLVLPSADDVVFYPGWLEQALATFRRGIDVVGTNDLTPVTRDGTHATMPIVRRSYVIDTGAAYGEKGVLFHEGYHHNFCETELCQLAQHRGVYARCPASIIEHRHPAWGTREADATDAKGNQQYIDVDEAVFLNRSKRWSR